MRKLIAATLVAVSISSSPANAVVPTEDVVAIARLAEVIRTSMAQLNTLIEATSIANAMKMALGEGPGAEWAAALDSASGLYSEGNRLAYNAANKTTSLQWELDRLSPASIQAMSIPELVAYGRRWQDTLQNDTLLARSLEAESIAQQAKINELKGRSLKASQRAGGVTSAVQAQTNLVGALAGQAETTGMTLASMANMQNNALLTEEKKNQMVEAFAKRNQEIGRQMFAGGVKRASVSPLRWGSKSP